VEKRLSLTFEETAALLEMSVCSYADTDDTVSTRALLKLRDLCREFGVDEKNASRTPATHRLRRAA